MGCYGVYSYMMIGWKELSLLAILTHLNTGIMSTFEYVSVLWYTLLILSIRLSI